MRFLAPYALAVAIAGGWVYAGIRYATNERAAEDAEDYIEGTEDARDATTDLPDDDAGLIEWLRDF